MGVAKSWVYTARILVLANSHNHNHHHHYYHKHKLSNLKQQNLLAEHHHCLLWPPEDAAAVAGGQRRRISWTVVCGVMLFVVGLVSFFMGHVASDLEWCSHKVVAKRRLLKKKVERFSGVSFDLWESNYSKSYYGCSERSPYYAARTNQLMSNGYLLIAASGGLNQQRTGITDAVVVARILNAALVIPELDHHSYWKDDSDFANIFDVDWFISSLAKDVTIVKKVPEKIMRSLEKPPYTMRVPRKSEPKFYLDEVLPILVKRRVLQLTKFDYRLANDLDEELQRMRCRVNYHALRFTKPIQNLGQKIVMKMRKMAPRFIAVHLRFEPDMLAFSGCYYGGGDKERNELGEIRKRWTTLPETSPDGERKRGKCPLTPHEVGLMLRALGFENNTHLYVASGEIYGGEQTLKPLRELFPNLYTKETLASEELEPFLPYSSRLAAIDYIVCDESDVFVTNNNGNMAKILAGRRRYMGHKRTIRPNTKKLNALFLKREKMPWESFAKKVKAAQQGFLGEPNEIKTARGEFHEYPSTCICKKPFMFSDLDRDYNKNLTLTRSPEPESEYGRNEEDQGVLNVQNIENAGLIEIQGGSPSIEEKDGVDFLAD